MSGSARWGRPGRSSAPAPLRAAWPLRGCLRRLSQRLLPLETSRSPASPPEDLVKFWCAPKSPFHRRIPALGAATCAPAASPGAAACSGIPGILLFLAASDEVITSPPLLPGSFRVPWHVRCSPARLPPGEFRETISPRWLLSQHSGWTSLSGLELEQVLIRKSTCWEAPACCYSIQRPPFAFVHAVSSTGWSLELWERGECEERWTNRS